MNIYGAILGVLFFTYIIGGFSDGSFLKKLSLISFMAGFVLYPYILKSFVQSLNLSNTIILRIVEVFSQLIIAFGFYYAIRITAKYLKIILKK